MMERFYSTSSGYIPRPLPLPEKNSESAKRMELRSADIRCNVLYKVEEHLI